MFEDITFRNNEHRRATRTSHRLINKYQELKKFIDSQVLSNLQKLENDDDVDVRFYSIKSIKGINEILT